MFSLPNPVNNGASPLNRIERWLQNAKAATVRKYQEIIHEHDDRAENIVERYNNDITANRHHVSTTYGCDNPEQTEMSLSLCFNWLNTLERIIDCSSYSTTISICNTFQQEFTPATEEERASLIPPSLEMR